MDSQLLRDKFPSIGPCLVPPFERPCFQGIYRYAALVLAQRGSVVLFAAETTRQFGVGLLDSEGRVSESDQYPSFEMAARVFLLQAHAD
jgi:hypothetical protein